MQKIATQWFFKKGWTLPWARSLSSEPPSVCSPEDSGHDLAISLPVVSMDGLLHDHLLYECSRSILIHCRPSLSLVTKPIDFQANSLSMLIMMIVVLFRLFESYWSPTTQMHIAILLHRVQVSLPPAYITRITLWKPNHACYLLNTGLSIHYSRQRAWKGIQR